MLRQLRCLSGHSWETEDADAAHCPRCGELADSVSLLDEAPPPPEIPQDRLDVPTRDGRGYPVIPGYDLREKLPPGPLGVERYRARQLVADRTVVVEVVVARDDPGQTAWAALRGEARALGKLDHPNVAPLLAVGERERLLFYNVLADDSGPTLAEWLGDKPLPWREAVDLGRVLALALQHAHERGVVHRAIQPRFIRLCPAEGGGPGCVRLRGVWYRPRLEKFGQARTKVIEHEPTDLDAQPEIPAYLSPEQALGQARAIGPKSDQIALGLVVAELLLGKPPLAGPNRMQTLDNAMRSFPILEPLRARVPADLSAVLQKATSFRAGDRYESAGELAADLANVLAGRPLRGRQPGMVSRFVRALFTSAALWALLLGGFLVLVLHSIPLATERENDRAVAHRLIADRDELQRLHEESLGSQAERLREAEEKLHFASRRANALATAQLGRLIGAGDLDRTRALLNHIPPEQRRWEWTYYTQQLLGLPPAEIVNDPARRPTALSFGERGDLALGLEVRAAPQEGTGRLEVWSGTPLRRQAAETFPDPVVALTRWRLRDILVLTLSRQRHESQLFRRPHDPAGALELADPVIRGTRTGLTCVTARGFQHGELYPLIVTTDHKSAILTADKRLHTLQPCAGPTGLLVAGGRTAEYFVADNAKKVILRAWESFEMANGRAEETLPLGDLENGTALATSFHGEWLAAGGSSGRVRLWATAERADPADTWQLGTRPISALAFPPEGDRLAVGTEDGRLVLLDIETGLELVNASLGKGAVTALAFDPTGRKLAVIHGERVLLWE